MLESKKIDALSELYAIREKIENNLAEIESILKVYFSEEEAVATQHWLAQIKTALKDNTKYLPRGEYSMDYTLARIEDKLFTKNSSGVNKYIK